MTSTQKDPPLDAIEWHGDPAASGYRFRAWIESPLGEPAELCVYEAEGDWRVGLPRTQYQWMAMGTADGLEDGKRRAYQTWLAMRDAPKRPLDGDHE